MSTRFLGVAALLVLVPIVASAGSDWAPIALGFISPGKLIVLSEDGQLWSVSTQSGKVPKMRIGQISTELTATDLGVASDGDWSRIIITSSLTTSSPGRTFLDEYSAPGRKVRTTSGPPNGYFSGVAIDSAKKLAYVVNASESSIESVRLTSNAQPLPNAQLTRVSKIRENVGKETITLGPLALDSRGQRLFVADSFNGKVYQVSLTTNNVDVFADGLGEPRALIVDAQTRRLLVADAARKAVWSFPLDGRTPHPRPTRPFCPAMRLMEPSALAIDQNGDVWTGDPRLNALFRCNSNGTFLERRDN